MLISIGLGGVSSRFSTNKSNHNNLGGRPKTAAAAKWRMVSYEDIFILNLFPPELIEPKLLITCLTESVFFFLLD